MIGTQIANYRIESMLGEGGMGVVYKAIDVTLDRPVAVKLLAGDLARDPGLIARFQSEAKAQANLNHTNIATLYSFLEVDGNCLIVMEFVEGETFDQIIRRRGLIPAQEAIPLFKQALLGIGFAHRMGIIHRDIKPSNIMVNRHGIVKVMDFGIAKAVGGKRLTRTGMQVGTVFYMSPEQIRNQPVDIRSDIYSLGVTLYEMLTAHLPFESDSDFQIMADHVNTPPPLLTRHYPYIPRGVEQAVLKALEKNADNRFQTVEEFGAALEHPQGLSEAEQRPAASAVAYPQPAPVAYAAPTPVTPMASPVASAVVVPGTPAASAAPVPAAGRKAWLPANKFLAVGAGGLAFLLGISIAAYRHFTSSKAPVKIASVQGPTGTLINSPIPPESSKVTTTPTVAETLKAQQPQGPGGESQTLPLTPEAAPKKTALVTPKTDALVTPKPMVKNSTPRNIPVARPPEPKPDPTVAMLQNAETAMSSGHLLDPPNNNALYWALQARQNGNPRGAAVELRVVDAVFQRVQADRAQKNFAGALNLLDKLAQVYPDRSDILQLRSAIVAEQQQWIVIQQNEAKIKRFEVVHRHVVTDNNFNMQKFYCGGILSIMPDGVVRYDCVQTNDPTGRCDKVTFPPGALKQVKISPPEETGLAHLHIGTNGMGNFDFYGKPQDIDNAFAALTPLVRRH